MSTIESHLEPARSALVHQTELETRRTDPRQFEPVRESLKRLNDPKTPGRSTAGYEDGIANRESSSHERMKQLIPTRALVNTSRKGHPHLPLTSGFLAMLTIGGGPSVSGYGSLALLALRLLFRDEELGRRWSRASG